MPDTLFQDLEIRRCAWGLAYAMMGNAADAEDVLQDAFLVAHDKARSVPPDEQTFWFVGVVRNVARNHIRKRRSRAMNELTETHALPERQRLEVADAEALLSALQEVSVDEREAIALFHMQGFSLDEVAAVLGVNRNTLKSRIQRGIAYLREKLRVSLPGLEAYLATVAIPPPEGGLDAALARWSRDGVPKRQGWPLVKLLSLGGAAVLVLAVSWAVLAPGDAMRNAATVVAADKSDKDLSSGPGSERIPTVVASGGGEKASASGEASQSGDSPKRASAPGSTEATPALPEGTRKKPSDMVPPGAFRTRTKFYENGVIEAQWSELQRGPKLFTLEGSFAGYYPTGVLRECGQYANNRRFGMWQSFHDNAALESRGEYRDDMQSGWWEVFNRDGFPLEKGEFKADLRSGEWQIFYSDTGTIKERVTFAEGKRHGRGTSFDRQGNVLAETSWSNGKKHGIERIYGAQGTEEQEYDRGLPVKQPRPR